MSTTSDPYMSVTAVVQATGFTEMWIRMMCKRGKVPGAVKMSDGRWMIPTDEVTRMIARIDTRQEHKQARAEGRAPKKHQAPFRVRALRYVIINAEEWMRDYPDASAAGLIEMLRQDLVEAQGAMVEAISAHESESVPSA